MVRDPFRDDAAPDLEVVLDALDDGTCRAIVKQLDKPMTANEISETAGVPLSTTYRKLELLADASLLDEMTEIRDDGHHTTLYAVDFEAVQIALDEQRAFEVGITRPPRTADERLEKLWTEVRKEA